MSLAELFIVVGIVVGPGLITLVLVRTMNARRATQVRAEAQAGWYADPHRSGTGWRWWDGSEWTDFTDEHHPSVTRTP